MSATRRLVRATVTAAAALVGLATTACIGPFESCDDVGNFGVQVTVVDSLTGRPPLGLAVLVVTEGTYSESAQASLQVLFSQIRRYEASLPEAKGWSPNDRARGRIVMEASGHSEKPGPASEELFIRNATGGVSSPFSDFLVLRGLKTLAVRMERHCRSAHDIAQFLLDHPKVREVRWPGLATHPGYEVAQSQMRDFGGMVSFVVTGGAEAAADVVSRTKLFTLAESLGAVESLIEQPAVMTHLSVAGSALDVDPALIRLSVGLETVDDLVADLDRALAG